MQNRKLAKKKQGCGSPGFTDLRSGALINYYSGNSGNNRTHDLFA